MSNFNNVRSPSDNDGGLILPEFEDSVDMGTFLSNWESHESSCIRLCARRAQ